MEDGDRIFCVGKKGMKPETGAKLEPGDPVGIFALGVVVINCVAHRLVNKAEVTAEFVADVKWHERHGAVCGHT